MKIVDIFPRLGLIALVLFTLPVAARAADAPELEFTADEVMLTGTTPGRMLSWVGMVREFDRTVPRLRIVRGLGPSKGGGDLSLGKGFDPSCSVWAVGGIDEPMTVVRAGARCSISSEAIRVTALPGASRLTIHSSIAIGHYIARRNSAWRFAVRDGSDLDADGEINGQIVMTLDTMGRLKGGPPPPKAISVGDTLLLLDSDRMRATAVEVLQ